MVTITFAAGSCVMGTAWWVRLAARAAKNTITNELGEAVGGGGTVGEATALVDNVSVSAPIPDRGRSTGCQTPPLHDKARMACLEIARCFDWELTDPTFSKVLNHDAIPELTNTIDRRGAVFGGSGDRDPLPARPSTTLPALEWWPARGLQLRTRSHTGVDIRVSSAQGRGSWHFVDGLI